MVDKSAILSCTDSERASFLYAIDVTFAHSLINHALPSAIPEAELQNTCKADKEDVYPGIFKVHPAALYHDFYVAIGSHIVSPIEIWKLMRSPQRRVRGELERRQEIERFRSSSQCRQRPIAVTIIVPKSPWEVARPWFPFG